MSDTITPSATVYLASFAALLGALSMGLALGYTAPAFLDVTFTDSPIFNKDPIIKDDEKSLIGSILAVGALLGGLLGEPCNKLFGRRLSLILFGGPFVAGWLLISFASSLTMVIMGRFVIGFCCGLVSGTAPTYVVEIAPPQIRGFLGTCFQVMVVIGILLAAVFGTFLHWQALAGVSTIAAIGMSFMMIFMPETPQYLLSKDNSEEAEASLKRLRTSAINNEFNVMTQSARNAQQAGSQYSFQVLSSREFYKPFMLAIGLMFFQQFSGINAVLFYQGDIFKAAAPSLNASLATIYVCVAQVIATILGSVLVDRLGRRILLLLSGIGHAGSLLAFGLYSYKSVGNAKYQAQWAWLSLASLIIFISSFSIGYGPIPWMMIPELSSSRVRSMVAALGTAINWTCVYLVTFFVKPLISKVGNAWTYWIFAIICTLSCLFVAICIPETKGKSNEQIQRELLGDSAPSNPSRQEDNAANQMKALA